MNAVVWDASLPLSSETDVTVLHIMLFYWISLLNSIPIYQYASLPFSSDKYVTVL